MKRVLAWLVIGAIGGISAEAVAEGPKERLAAIEAAQKTATERYNNELMAAGKAESARNAAVDRFLEQLFKNMESALSFARANPDDPAAFEALKFVIRSNGSGPGTGTKRALRMILERGDTRTPEQGSYLNILGLSLSRYPDAETLLRRVLVENPNRDDRAAACYWLSTYLRQQASIVRRLRDKPDEMKYYEHREWEAPIRAFVHEKNPVALEQEATALLERAVNEFGDVKLADDKRAIADFATGELLAARTLNVGQPAPDIVGADHQGEIFKLSDYRGKVVLLTFSGNWCGPCVEMYPQERALVARLKDRPFALVSVNTDADVKTLQAAIVAGKITWRCWTDGAPDVPITTRWGVTGFPAIFVLDRQGVIRAKNLRGDDLDRSVAALLDEAVSKDSSSPARSDAP